jgi:hypothetical protein
MNDKHRLAPSLAVFGNMDFVERRHPETVGGEGLDGREQSKTRFGHGQLSPSWTNG